MEGCGYRDLYDQFEARGVSIVGVSYDSPEANLAWAIDEGFQYELWTDTNRELATAYGAGPTLSAAKRVTMLLDSDGDLVLEYLNVNAEIGTSPQLLLADIDALWPNLAP